ncbi:MAG TPA: hypothetical protein VEB19_14640 [Gemmatimonadaceae bacterium]|nr:hypothetical protein [Gemmatimonadaceae bacterium]
MRLILPLLLLFVTTPVVRAQDPAVDSARTARSAWASAVRAIREGDTTAARVQVDRAASAWPTQPYYRWQQILLAARAHDTALVRAKLLAFTRMELSADLEDSALSEFRERPWFAHVRSLNAANASPIVRSEAFAILRTPTIWPEGVDVDVSSGTVYVSSIRHRTIMEFKAGHVERPLWPLDSGPGAVLAVRRAPSGDALWVTIAGLPQMRGFHPSDSGTAALLKVRIADGAILRRIDLPPGKHVPGDLAVTRAGDIYVSDSHEPVLYRLAAGSDRLEAIRSPLFRSLQGIAIDPSGRVFLADYSHGLLRLDPATGEVIRIADAPHSTALGCDGIAWHNGAIIAIQNGFAPARIMRFRLNGAADSVATAEVIDRNSALADEPTLGVVIGDDLYYVANSQWEKYTAAGVLRPGVILSPPVILRLRLKL